jgi:4-hydroxy-tetrahydrodipicolinate synthase
MPRHPNYIPHGVIPAVLLPFDNDVAIDEQSFRSSPAWRRDYA